MIYTQYNSINNIVVTGRENSLIYITGGTPYYVLELFNQMTNETKVVVTPILSSNSRYDLIQLTITGNSTSQNLTAGTIYLPYNNYFNYKLYEKSIISTTINSTDTLLEQGLMFLSGDSLNNIISYNNTNTIITYNN